MSHVVAASVIVQDLDILRTVIERQFPKLHWRANQKTYKWYGSWQNDYSQDDAAYKQGIDTNDYGKCEVALHMDGVQYEIGIVKRKDGAGYSLVWDFFSDGERLSKYIGNSAEKLMTAYAEEFVHQFAQAEGYMLHEFTNEEGVKCIEMTR